MTSKLVSILMAIAFVLSGSALAQTASSVPSAASAAAPAASTGTKIGVINIEAAIYACNEGQKEFGELSKKLEPKQAQLKTMSDELDGLKKQLSTQGDKMNQDAHDNLARQIDAKQKIFDRDMQDARDDFQTQQNEIAQKILEKLAPILRKFADQNGYGLIIDTTQAWPQGPVVMAGPSFDITKAVVDAYNLTSGVAPPAPSAARPPATHPAGSAATKPSTNPK